MSDHEAIINKFYQAFSERDADTMASCYHSDVHFTDPVFPDLRGPQVGAMWKMLCERGKDLSIEHSQVTADGDRGTAHWDATYTFGATGRKVLNRIDASFEFRDGAIVRHVDEFNLYRWSRMALGLPGVLLGWTPIIQGKIRRQAAGQLEKYMAKQAG